MNGQGEMIALWFEYAMGDLQTAVSLRQNEGVPLRNVCYMAQQSVEKAIKCLFVHYRIEVVKSHDLVYLHKKLPSGLLLGVEVQDLAWLSYWAVEARYPGDWPDVNTADADRAIGIAQTVCCAIKKIIDT